MPIAASSTARACACGSRAGKRSRTGSRSPASLPTGRSRPPSRREPGGAAHEFVAADYDELVDHPVELGRFWRGSFSAAGIAHEFVVAGALPDFDGETLLADAKRICETAIAFWHREGGKAPFERYLFLLNAVDEGRGGLEHRASTALVAPRRHLPRRADRARGARAADGAPAARAQPAEGYTDLLGLISHEYFHAWNVKRLKPRDFARLDYARENYTRLLWFFEGFTSYYDDLLLLRGGLIDAAHYLQLVAKTMTAVAGTPGRELQSVAASSFDAWVKYYRGDENTPNATVSYYAKGALVALAFDLTLRSEGRGSLDEVMRRLWTESQGGPIDEGDIADALEAVGGRSYAAELAAWVHGTGELPLAELLPRFGVGLERQPATLAQRLGVRVSESALTGVKVTHVLRGGGGERIGLAAGDELIGVGGWRLRRLDDALRFVARRGRHAALRRPRSASARPALRPGPPRRRRERRGAAASRRRRERRGPATRRGMDLRLSRDPATEPVRRRAAAFVALVVAVVLVHGWLTARLAERMAEIDSAAAKMPPRVEVAYVKTLELEAPKPLAAAVAPRPPPRPRAPRVAKRVEPAASAASATGGGRRRRRRAVRGRTAASAPEPTGLGAGRAALADPAVAVRRRGGAGAAAPAASAVEGFVWPKATRVSYLLTGNWRGELNGRAEVEWIKIDDRYQVNVAMHAGPEFAPLVARRMTSEGRIVEGGLAPERYEEETKVVTRDDRRVSMVFAPDSVTLGNGQQRVRLPGVQDTASQFIQFTWMFGSQPERLRVGNTFEFPLALPRSMNVWVYDVAEEEVLHTAIGPLNTFHLKPRRTVRRPGEWVVEMWFAPELRFLPVRLRIEQDANTYVELLIARKPEMSGP